MNHQEEKICKCLQEMNNHFHKSKSTKEFKNIDTFQDNL